MANIKSAKKRIRSSEKARVRNLVRKRKLKESIKETVKAAVVDKKAEGEVKGLISKAYKDIDKAAKTGAIHANKAARMKSRMMSRLNKAGGRGK
ncbi:MAG TPA: 30S ribosomal protein S20 [bacterium]|nr:30S ribosomal protein S20 [bacterium]HPN67237.1 30S ribosomal protein S20 [bacterium]